MNYILVSIIDQCMIKPNFWGCISDSETLALNKEICFGIRGGIMFFSKVQTQRLVMLHYETVHRHQNFSHDIL